LSSSHGPVVPCAHTSRGRQSSVGEQYWLEVQSVSSGVLTQLPLKQRSLVQLTPSLHAPSSQQAAHVPAQHF